MLGALKYLQLDYCCPSLVLVRLRLLFGSWKDVDETTGSDQIPAELTESGSETY
jgi:hypothetical protein